MDMLQIAESNTRIIVIFAITLLVLGGCFLVLGRVVSRTKYAVDWMTGGFPLLGPVLTLFGIISFFILLIPPQIFLVEKVNVANFDNVYRDNNGEIRIAQLPPDVKTIVTKGPPGYVLRGLFRHEWVYMKNDNYVPNGVLLKSEERVIYDSAILAGKPVFVVETKTMASDSWFAVATNGKEQEGYAVYIEKEGKVINYVFR